MNPQNLFNCIRETVRTIDTDLKATVDKGIFFAPELYTAFSIGRDIKKNSEIIFNSPAEWLRETNFGCGGPTDITFKVDNRHFFIEVKLRDNISAYTGDIEKLRRLDNSSAKLFCVLLDSFTPENDGRLTELERQYSGSVHKIGHYSFPTWNDWYTKQIFCNLNLYSIS